jgi:prephenate dehydrogenase
VMSSNASSVHIIGCGMIGTSLGLALRRVDWDVTLEDVDPRSVDEAIAIGAGRRRTADEGEPDVVVAATPPGQVGEVLAAAAATWTNATLTHVASVQTRTQDDAVQRGVPARRLVGGHPMAGREISGPQGGRADLFDDRVWVVCPAPTCAPDRVDQVRQMVRLCGARPVDMSVHDHDSAVAMISHTPQVLASVLAGRLVDAPDDVVALAGQGFRDMTRISSSNPDLWEEILRWNATSVTAVISGISEELSQLVADLSVHDDPPAHRVDAVRDVLARGVRGHARIPGKHGERDRPFEVISVMVKDEPGQLARLFVAAGELGVNLEDVRIEHVMGRPSGLIDLSVQPHSAAHLRDGLMGQGFDVRS